MQVASRITAFNSLCSINAGLAGQPVTALPEKNVLCARRRMLRERWVGLSSLASKTA